MKRWARVTVTITAIVLGWWWAWRRLRHTYLFYDEWSMVERVMRLPPIEGMFAPFNRHLWVIQDPIYRLQIGWLGADNHWAVVVAFLGALAVQQMVLAALFERMRMSWVPALLLGTALTYMGTAAQNFIFAVQVSPLLATAAGLAPVILIVDRHPTRVRLLAVATLLVLSTLTDSAFGLTGLALTAVVAGAYWGVRRLWCLVPAALVLAWWYGFVDLGVNKHPSTISAQIRFAVELLVRSAGALVGGEVVAGLVVIGIMAVAFVATLRWSIGVDRRAMSAGGSIATVLMLVGIARYRAGIEDLPWELFNRYFQSVGIPLMIAGLPAVLAVADRVFERTSQTRLSDASVDWRTRRPALASLLIVLAFGAGLPTERRFGDDFVAANQLARAQVSSAVMTIEHGCPLGTDLVAGALPLAELSPQVTVELLIELIDRDLIHADSTNVEDPDVTARMCA